MTLAVTQEAGQALVKVDGDGEFTTLPVLAQVHPQGDLTVTQQFIQVLGKRNTTVDTNFPAFTQVTAQMLMSVSPEFGWIDMFVDTLFPFDISYNSIGATRFQTDVSQVDSGADQRIRRWDQPLMEYDIAYGVRTMEQLHGLIAFFRAMRGKLYSFKYKDHMDHTSTTAVAVEARKPPAVSFTDQALGTGDGSTYKFQLKKAYATPDGAYDFLRPIYKPMGGTVRVGIQGVETANFVVDLMTGIVTFTSDLIASGGTMSMAFLNSTQWQITSTPGKFTGFNGGDKLVISGWNSALNNTTVDDVTTVANVSGDGSTMVINEPAAGYGANEANCTTAVVRRHPAPKSGQVLTAGFEFYVPVRFDTDRLPTTIEEYGVGSASDIKLVEVRPWDE